MNENNQFFFHRYIIFSPWNLFLIISVLFLSIPLNLYIGKVESGLQEALMELRSTRTKQSNEVSIMKRL